jgi:hypothetical protein
MQVRRMARRLGWDRNPLRRASDRLETVLTLVLVLAALTLSPWVGRRAAETAFRDVARTNAWEREHHHLIQAELVEVVVAGAAAGGRHPDAGTAVARWTAPDGTIRTGTVYVSAGRRIGNTAPVWVDDDGWMTGPPSHRNPRVGAGLAAALSVCAVGAGLAGVRRIVRRHLDRRRLRAWQLEWAIIEPRWTRHR